MEYSSDATEMDCNDTEQLLPLVESKYGPFLNASLDFNIDFIEKTGGNISNMSDAQLAKSVCQGCKENLAVLHFNDIQLARVIVTWLLFFISAVGNIFVLCCVCRKARTSHVHMIMMHFAIADLAFTFLVLPKDAMWNTTMQWYGGEFLCRICQMGKQIGMYISSFMVVVMALDRCCGILQPMCTNAKQRKRTKYLVGGAWILSVLSAIPPAILFSVEERPACPNQPPFLQCVDNLVVTETELRRPYYFYTMAMSFLVPMILCFIFYSLVICEISNMMRRDRIMRGRRDSAVSITRARRKTLKMTALVTLTFLLFWGPYYGYGVYSWFHPLHRLPQWAFSLLFVLMYVHPAIHPFIYGVLMKDVRDTFKTVMLHIEKIATCSSSEQTVFHETPCTTDIRLSCGDGSLPCMSSPEKARFPPANGYVLTDDYNQRETATVRRVDQAGLEQLQRNQSTNDERDRLISTNSVGNGDTAPAFTKAKTNGTTRTSQVSFMLPNKLSDTNGFNNNNKEVDDQLEDDIFSSTDV